MIWNWKWKKMLLSMSSKYSYFEPVFNYTRIGFWKRTLICQNCNTLMCFHPWTPNISLSALHQISLQYTSILPQIPCKRISCRTCQSHGNKRACLGSQPLKFSINHQQTFLDTKSVNAHARIKMQKSCLPLWRTSMVPQINLFIAP
jgi:hypothetical protein